MYVLTRRWGLVAVAFAVVIVAPRLQAEDPAPAPRAMASFKIDGMT